MIDRLTASRDARHLTIFWESGETSELAATDLRREARDAFSTREKLDHGAIRVAEGIEITGLFPVGAHGVNVHFSDGHEQAVYPFPYLKALSEKFDK